MVFHRGVTDSIPDQVLWKLGWTKWHWGSLFPSSFCPLLILIPPNAPYISVVWGWYNENLVADIPSGLSVTQPQDIKEKYLILEKEDG
jgi:hypothetical protein